MYTRMCGFQAMHVCKVYHGHLEYFGSVHDKENSKLWQFARKVASLCQINDDGFSQTFAENLMKTLKHGSLLKVLLIFFWGGGFNSLSVSSSLWLLNFHWKAEFACCEWLFVSLW